MKRNRNHVYMPNDVLVEILLRLSAKSLGRFKCVCRNWNDLIQNPSFIENHSNHPRNTRLFAFSHDFTSTNYKFSLFNDEPLSLRQHIHNPITDFPEYRSKIEVILGPVNGLYFMSYYKANNSFQALWNPTRSEFRELPPLPSLLDQTPDLEFEDRYFGFGSTDDDIKVVKITIYHSSRSRVVMITLYSLNDDSWKNIEYDSVSFPFVAEAAQPLYNDKFNHLNGVYYWLTIQNDALFLFDMKTEEFREVNLPKLCFDMHDVEGICIRDNSSVVLFVNQLISGSIDLWEMKEEGKWFKLLSFAPCSTYCSLDAFAYGFWKKDEIVIKTCDKDKKVVLYNMNSHETRILEIEWSRRIIFLNYQESLASVRGPSKTHSSSK